MGKRSGKFVNIDSSCMPLEKTAKISNVLVALVAKITFLFWCFSDIPLSKQHENFELRNRSHRRPCIKVFFHYFNFFRRKLLMQRGILNSSIPLLYSCQWNRAWNVCEVSNGRFFSLRRHKNVLQNWVCWQFATVTDQRKIMFLDVDNMIVRKSSKSLLNIRPTRKPALKIGIPDTNFDTILLV